MRNATHRFAAAMSAAGIAPPDTIVADGKLHRFSTNGKRGDTAGWYYLDLSHRAHGAFGCWRSGQRGQWSQTVGQHRPHYLTAEYRRLRAQEKRLREEQVRLQWAKNASRNLALMAEAGPAQHAVRDYLASRGLSNWSIPPCIREHPGLSYWEPDDQGVMQYLGKFSAMLAPVVRDGALVAVHRTYLDRGGKANVPTPRKLTPPSGPLAGAFIPLAEPRDGVIGVAEGIETAAAASLGAGLPVVAAYCAQSLANYEWPEVIDRLVIFGDNDEAGAHAVHTLARRATQKNVANKILIPSVPGSDWADVWKEAQK